MITNLLFAIALAGAPTSDGAAPTAMVRELRCTTPANAAKPEARRCVVEIPAGATVRACTADDRAAKRCALHPKGKYVAWTVASGGAECRLWKKKTKWKKQVGVKVAKKAPAAARCELRVVVG